MTTKPLDLDHVAIVGERGGKDPGEAVWGYTGKRLARLMGVSDEQYLQAYRLNLWEYDDEESIEVTELRVASDLASRLEGNITILLGRRVAASFGLPKAPFLTAWRIVRGDSRLVVAIISHTSGRSRLYNDEAYRRRTVEFLRKLMKTKNELLKKSHVSESNEDLKVLDGTS